VSRVYRNVARLAVKAAREADPKALMYAGEPGGVNLGFIDELNRNGLTSVIDGVTLYPASQWQPGVPNDPENFLLPFATLRERLVPNGGNARDYWVGGMSWPALDAGANDPAFATMLATTDAGVRERLLKTFTPQAQADYLMRAMTLSLAAGSDKVFWGHLQDAPGYERVEPINPEFGSGLLRRDMTPRPSYAALQTLTRLIGDKPFTGALALGPNAVALVFDDGKEGHIAAWAVSGKTSLVLNTLGQDPKVPDSIYVTTRASSQVLDASGAVVAGAETTLPLTTRPVWITKIGIQTAQRAEKTLRLAAQQIDYTTDNGVQATFVERGGEAGLNWRKYADFRGAANRFVTLDGRSGVKTEISRDVFKPGDGRPFIFMDVADDYLYFARGVPVTVTVEVHRTKRATGGVFASTGGFNVEYDSPTGFKHTAWQTVEEGEGWVTYTYQLPDASFSNRDGFDLLINTWGSKQDLVFSRVTVQRADTARPTLTPAVSPGNPALSPVNPVVNPAVGAPQTPLAPVPGPAAPAQSTAASPPGPAAPPQSTAAPAPSPVAAPSSPGSPAQTTISSATS